MCWSGSIRWPYINGGHCNPNQSSPTKPPLFLCPLRFISSPQFRPSMADRQFHQSSSWWTATTVPCRPDFVSLPATPPLVNCSAVLGRSVNYCDSSVTFQDHPSAPAIHAPAMDHLHVPHDWSQVYSIHDLNSLDLSEIN